MKKEIERPPKVALCRICKGTDMVTVSRQMTLDIRPYKAKTLKRHW